MLNWDLCNVDYRVAGDMLVTERFMDVDGVRIILSMGADTGAFTGFFTSDTYWKFREVDHGQLYIFLSKDAVADKDIRDFVLYHEIGHIKLKHIKQKEDTNRVNAERMSTLKTGKVHLHELEADEYAVGRVGLTSGIYALEKHSDILWKKLTRMKQETHLLDVYFKEKGLSKKAQQHTRSEWESTMSLYASSILEIKLRLKALKSKLH